MRTTELYCDTHNSVIEVDGEFVCYRTSDISEDNLTELVSRTPLLQEFDTTLKELNESFARIELNVVITPVQSVSASLKVITDNIVGAGYGVPLTEDEKRRWTMIILANVNDKQKPLMQRFFDAGYPREEVFFHQRENDLYVYNTLLSTRVIDEWCKDNGFDKEQRCAPYKGTVTGRQMYVCKLLGEKEASRTKAVDSNEKRKKHKDKKHRRDDYAR